MAGVPATLALSAGAVRLGTGETFSIDWVAPLTARVRLQAILLSDASAACTRQYSGPSGRVSVDGEKLV